MSENKRVSFPVDKSLLDRIHSSIPWGIRAEVLRQLITRVMDSADEHGELVYGAVVGGQFSINYKLKGKKK